MKILTAAQMREMDRLTIASGVPSLLLMENAACRVVEFLTRRYGPLGGHRIVILCGKGNNGGDGLAIARQLAMNYLPASLDVVLPWPESELSPDASANLSMLGALGIKTVPSITPAMHGATIVVDAVLGSGLEGPARGRALELVREINSGFPLAEVVAVDLPSGLHPDGEFARASATVTFTAPKIEHALPPTCDSTGELVVAQIGTPRSWLDIDPELNLSLITPQAFARLFEPRPRGAHKGDFGHVLVVGGARGKGGAASMAGHAALCAGAGLVTVATEESERHAVTAIAPELMTQAINDDPGDKDVLAVGPGLGRHPDRVGLAQRLFAQSALPMVIDADGLNALAGTAFHGPGPYRVLTPHPGEMARLTGLRVDEILADRIDVARAFATERNVVVVLKGQRTLAAFPDGLVFVNPTGTPAMATAGSGDILTGLIAGLLAQWPDHRELALLAAIWLHGRMGELAADELTEGFVTATSLLGYFPEAVNEVRDALHR